MATFFFKCLVYTLSSCSLMIAGLCLSAYVEREGTGPGEFMAFVGLYNIYFLFGLPLSLLVAATAELAPKRDGVRIFALTIAVITASILFLQTDRIGGGGPFYFMSNPDRAPILIGRSLEFLNPSPLTMQSNVATYFPILAIMTFFLPILLCPLIRRLKTRAS